MLDALLPAGTTVAAAAYGWYVAALGAAVQLAVLLSLLVSADRLLNVAKYAFIRARGALTGRLPKDDWFCAPLPGEAEEHPMVRRAWRAAGGGRRGTACLGLSTEGVTAAQPSLPSTQRPGYAKAAAAGLQPCAPM